MEMWSEIRREVLAGTLSKQAAIAKYGVGWHTLKKMLAHDEPRGYRNVANFKDVIYFYCGGLRLYP